MSNQQNDIFFEHQNEMREDKELTLMELVERLQNDIEEFKRVSIINFDNMTCKNFYQLLEDVKRQNQEEEVSEDYPIGGTVEPYDIMREDKLV